MNAFCPTPEVVIIIQARAESSRFAGKINECLFGNTSLLSFLLQRLVMELDSRKEPPFTRVFLAMPDTEASRTSISLIRQDILSRINIFYGDSCNVLQRFRSLILENFDTPPSYLVRICADNPFVDWKMVMADINLLPVNPSPYKQPYFRGVPSTLTQLGLAYEIISSSKLLKASCCDSDAEHVTLSMYKDWRITKDKYKLRDLEQAYGLNLEFVRLTVDYSSDLQVARSILSNFEDKIKATTHEILSFAISSPSIRAAMEYNISNALPKY